MASNTITFGMLTAKSASGFKFAEFDLNKDGFIDIDEFLDAIEKLQYDTLEISSADKNKDQKITDEEFDLWTQEEEINKLCEDVKTKAARDLAGEDNDDIVKFLNAIDEFKEQFFKSHKENDTDVKVLAEEFSKLLTLKYAEIMDEVLCNTKSSTKTRVIENIIDNISKNNTNFSDKNNKTLSENTVRLLSSILQKEADKFAKKYSGEYFEEDLTAYLEKFLNQSDKEKLADAIFMWDTDLEYISNMPPETALKNMKDRARDFLNLVLEQGISVTMGSVTIRTAVGIIPALSQYKNIDTLLYAIKNIINNLSQTSKLNQIISDADNGKDNENIEFPYDFELNSVQNIFEMTIAA